VIHAFSVCKYMTVRLYWMSTESVMFLCVRSVQTECSEGLSNRIKKSTYNTLIERLIFCAVD
jgi:hypothetical protein